MKYHALLLSLFICFQTISAVPGPSPAIDFILQHADSLNLNTADIEELSLSSSHLDQTTGIGHFYVSQGFKGHPIMGALATLVRKKNGDMELINHRFLKNLSQVLHGTATFSSQEILSNYRADQRTSADDNIRISGLIWVNVGSKWHLAYDIRLKTNAGAWRIFKDAKSGQEIRRENLFVQCRFGEKHHTSQHQDCTPIPPANAPSQILMNEAYNVFPLPVESPTHGKRSLVVSPADPLASPLGWHSIDAGAESRFTDTRGNNVFAQSDLDGNDIAEQRPNAGEVLTFDYSLDLNANPEVSEDASVVNLFYWSNLNHDIFYHYGFDEAAGNFQINNFEKGGLGDDLIYADALDGSQFNNAQILVEEDGFPALLETFVWIGSLYNTDVFANGSNGTQIVLPAVESGFSFNNKLRNQSLQELEIVLVEDLGFQTHLACPDTDIANPDQLNGKIALIDRGDCFFVEKVKRLQNLGAEAVIVCNNTPADPIVMGGDDQSITIPAVAIGQNDCRTLRNLMLNENVTVQIKPKDDSRSYDSALDNGIVTHEYAHGISIRLTGGAGSVDCLYNDEQMGEGWSDYFGLMLTTDWSSAQPGDKRGIGTFVSGQLPNGNGIRPYPYSTDLTINPMDYTNLNSFPSTHEVGAFWCSMLWEMTWSIIDFAPASTDLYLGQGGNNIAIRLVMEGLKLQACSPGFVDGRDAILKADELLYDGKYAYAIWRAFAKRGLGVNADQRSTSSVFDGQSDHELPSEFVTTVEAFDAKENVDLVTLSFTSIQEFGNRSYEVQRSTDNVNFQTIVTFEGRDLELSARDFDFDDNTAAPYQLYYYRLKQTSSDLQEQIMGMDSVILIPFEDMVVFPNPTNGQVNVKIDENIQGNVAVNLYSLNGSRVFMKAIPAAELHALYSLDFSALPSGMYILEVFSDLGRYQRKIVLR